MLSWMPLPSTQHQTDKGKRLKIFYGTQVSVKPPTFVIFVNEEELMHFSYMRFLENQIRQAFGFEGTPIHLIARKRKSKKRPTRIESLWVGLLSL